MQHRIHAVIAVALGLMLVIGYWGCHRLIGDPSQNQIPEVFLVNVPLDSSTFNYAPVLHWTGHDPDGVIAQYQYRYRGDTTAAAIAAYAAWLNGDAQALTRYCEDHPDVPWEAPTESTEDTIYLKRNEADTLTQMVFMVRCFDDLGGASQVKGRLFSRTNLAPYAPKIRWARDTELDTELGYRVEYVIPDTLLWGDLTLTYPGINFLWQGTDPDSRSLNIITLRFSYLLVNETTGDTMPYPLLDDSNRVIGFRSGWSDTTTTTQVTFSRENVTLARQYYGAGWDFELDGSYRMMVEVFDDGFTKSDTMAVATFTAVEPLWSDPEEGKQLLMVDWNKTPDAADLRFGARDDQEILDFYLATLPEGFTLAENLRQALYNYPGGIEQPFTYDPDQVQWYADKDICEAGRVPFDLIRHFKWIWVICDNPPRNPCAEPTVIYDRLKVFQEYLNSGGQVMITGRGLFNKVFTLTNAGQIDASGKAGFYLANYHNLSTIEPKIGQNESDADFGGATTTSTILAPMEMDSLIVNSLNFRNNYFWCLPEVDYFGRTASSGGYDYSETIFNYKSCSANASYEAENVDCNVLLSTPSIAYLQPGGGHDRILAVHRVYNVTRAVYGEFMDVDRDPATHAWRIIVSTPAEAGAWTSDDLLEVDYTYIPVAASHDQPVGSV
ncbi:MAG: hypothetical protein PHI18_10660, partial [bacterium]|nr:hypothetical protein [bacterium]